MTKRVVLTSIGICLLAACEMPRPGNDVQQQDATQDIVLSDIVPMPDVAADSAPDASEAEAGATDASDAAANADSADVMPPPACPTAASDFQPRTAMGTWAAPWSMCQAVSMANAYPYFSMSASAPGRVRTLGGTHAELIPGAGGAR